MTDKNDIKFIFRDKIMGVCIGTLLLDIEKEHIPAYISQTFPNSTGEYLIVDSSDIPQTDYLDALDFDMEKKSIFLDVKKMREIKMERIRIARDQELKKVSGTDKPLHSELEKILDKKTKDRLTELRDLPKNIKLEKFATVKEIEDYWPEALDIAYKESTRNLRKAPAWLLEQIGKKAKEK